MTGVLDRCLSVFFECSDHSEAIEEGEESEEEIAGGAGIWVKTTRAGGTVPETDITHRKSQITQWWDSFPEG